MAFVVLTSADNGARISLPTGASVVLRLPENPTTGYRWTVAPHPPVVAMEEGDDTQSGALIGAGGERCWHLRAISPGTTSLAFKHWREWEGESSVIERYALTVHVMAPRETESVMAP
ncbi:MAG: protease inhibitor I42 family protein [Cyanobacteriota bacterium]